MLENHADLGADLFDVFQIVGEFGAVDDDAPLLVFFQAIDTADEC
jgi:hypothetical protein